MTNYTIGPTSRIINF